MNDDLNGRARSQTGIRPFELEGDLELTEWAGIAIRPTEAELRCAKDQYKVSTVLSLESTFNRMSRLARHEIFHGRQIPVDEVLERIEAITLDEVVRVTNEVFGAERLALAVVGDIDGVEIDRGMLVC